MQPYQKDRLIDVAFIAVVLWVLSRWLPLVALALGALLLGLVVVWLFLYLLSDALCELRDFLKEDDR